MKRLNCFLTPFLTCRLWWKRSVVLCGYFSAPMNAATPYWYPKGLLEWAQTWPSWQLTCAVTLCSGSTLQHCLLLIDTHWIASRATWCRLTAEQALRWRKVCVFLLQSLASILKRTFFRQTSNENKEIKASAATLKKFSSFVNYFCHFWTDLEVCFFVSFSFNPWRLF